MPRTGQRTRIQNFIVTGNDAIVGSDGFVLNIHGFDETSAGAADGILVRGGNRSGIGAGAGGSISIIGGFGQTAAGGPIIITAGATSDFNAANVLITGGSAASVGPAYLGGNVSLQPGSGVNGGADGTIIIDYATWPVADAAGVLNSDGFGALSWASSSAAVAGIEGNIYDSLVFYMDAADRNSYPGSGATVTDIEGNGTAGTLTGSAYSEGAFNFDGATGNLTFTKGATLDNIFDGGGTVIVFARPLSNGESGGFMVTTAGAGSPTPTGDGWFLAIRDPSSGRSAVEFQANFSGGDGTWRTFNQTSDADPTPLTGFTGTPPLGYGQWSAVAVVYDADLDTNDPTFYINGTQWTLALGIQQTSGPSGMRSTDAPNDLIIGNSLADARTWDGDIAVVLFFNRALSAAEVSQVQSTFAARFGLGPFGGQRSDGMGQNVVMRGGISSGTGSDMDGGTVTLIGGDTNSTGFGVGGDVFIRAGDKTGTGNTRGGNMTIRSGEGNLGSNLTIGVGTVHTANGQGNMIVHGGDNDATGSGGDSMIRGGEATAAGGGSHTGGDMVVRTGSSRGAAANGVLALLTRGSSNSSGFETGDIYLSTRPGTVPGISTTLAPSTGTATTRSGDIFIDTNNGGTGALSSGQILISSTDYTNNGSVSTGGATLISITCGADLGTTAVHDQGSITITAGAKAGSGRAGPITITGGAKTGGGAAASAPGGIVTITGGDSTVSNATSGGGSSTLAGGEATGIAGPGGDVNITAGSNTAAGVATGVGGDVMVTSGSVTSGTSTSDAGDIFLTPGTAAGSGADGSVIIDYATWPAADGPFGTALTTDSAGTLSWSQPRNLQPPPLVGAVGAPGFPGETIQYDPTAGTVTVTLPVIGALVPGDRVTFKNITAAVGFALVVVAGAGSTIEDPAVPGVLGATVPAFAVAGGTLTFEFSGASGGWWIV